jgi:RHS repeat-associated protein
LVEGTSLGVVGCPVGVATVPGNPETISGTPTSGPRYAWLGGAQRDASSFGGVVMMGARIYVPLLGRFTSVDPIRGGSANPYDYCNQDPVNSSDLQGTSSDAKNGTWRFPLPPEVGTGGELTGYAICERSGDMRCEVHWFWTLPEDVWASFGWKVTQAFYVNNHKVENVPALYHDGQLYPGDKAFHGTFPYKWGATYGGSVGVALHTNFVRTGPRTLTLEEISVTWYLWDH